MELTQEQMDNLVFKITEKVLVRMPDVIGHLIMEHSSIHKMTKGFYDKHPEFKNDAHSVRSIISKLEKEDVTMEYDAILEKAVPLIKRRMKSVSELSFDKIDENIKDKLDISNNGAL
ncbi:MAG: hypothetical protein DRH93_11675 [Deltaproteobacteria bacterium]|nr:MAG: hypothetical protein DRH93_11675 [Deltaproteobacteria bacterium]